MDLGGKGDAGSVQCGVVTAETHLHAMYLQMLLVKIQGHSQTQKSGGEKRETTWQ